MVLTQLGGGGYDDVQDTAPSSPSIGDTWLDTSNDPPVGKVYADLGGGGGWHQEAAVARVLQNLDAPVSGAGASSEVKTHDLRFVREMSRLFFDRSMSELNFTQGIFDVFVDDSKLTVGDPAPFTSYGADGYLYLYGVWDVAGGGEIASLSTQGGSPQGLAWGNNGTKLYEADRFGSLYEWDVSTAWDITTATYVQSIAGQDGSPRSISWKPDGTKMYEAGDGGNNIYEWDVSTAWDISTATFVQSISSSTTGIKGVAWKPDGTKLYEVGDDGAVYGHDLSTAWDISTTSSPASSSVQNSNPSGLAWKPDGTKLYVTGSSGGTLEEYDVSTAWDISDISFNQSKGSPSYSPQDIDWKSDGEKMYVMSSGDDSFHEYQHLLSEARVSWTVSLGFSPSTAVVSHTTEGDLTVDYTITDSAGNSVTIPDADVDTEYDVSALADGDLTIEAALDSPDVTSDDKQRDFSVYFD